MSQAHKIACDNPACTIEVTEDGIDNWIQIQTLLSERTMQEKQKTGQQMLASGAFYRDVGSELNKDALHGDFCSLKCLIAFASYKLNELMLSEGGSYHEKFTDVMTAQPTLKVESAEDFVQRLFNQSLPDEDDEGPTEVPSV